jgi:hypothetical protein
VADRGAMVVLCDTTRLSGGDSSGGVWDRRCRRDSRHAHQGEEGKEFMIRVFGERLGSAERF